MRGAAAMGNGRDGPDGRNGQTAFEPEIRLAGTLAVPGPQLENVNWLD
jgi:hypothetical protein